MGTREELPHTTGELDYALVKRVTEIRDIDTDDTEGLENDVTRSRGFFNVDSVENRGDGEQTEAHHGSFIPNKTEMDSGYVIQILEKKHTQLHPWEVAALPSIPDQRLPERVFDTLAPDIKRRVNRDGMCPVSGFIGEDGWRYSTGHWVDIEIGGYWELILELREADFSPTSVLDFLLYAFGPEHLDIDTIAAERTVSRRTVRRNVEMIIDEYAGGKGGIDDG
jgi:hypothetical protein